MARINKAAITDQARLHFPAFRRARAEALRLNAWVEGRQFTDGGRDPNTNLELGRPFRPTEPTSEHEDLATRAPVPWGGAVVTALAQTAYVDGIRASGSNENLKVWATMERNSWARRQIAIHRAAIAHGQSFATAMPGRDPLTGDKMAVLRGKSLARMSAFYDDDDDEWCQFAIEAVPFIAQPGEDSGWQVKLYDEVAVHYLFAKGEGLERSDWTYISFEEHPCKVPPVTRCANRLDNEGIAHGEIAPVIPLLRSIDQDKFDRLIVQRYGAWKVRYIAGMAKPSTRTEQNYQAMKLKVEDILISTDSQTKFGTMDATDVAGFIAAHDADLRVLSAIAQIPPHHLLGLSSNLQAEALAAAEAGLQRKSGDFRTGAGEFHEQTARLAAIINGDTAEARMFDAQARWRDTESRSMTQAADALFKVAQGLKVPVEMLWERIPGWTDSDTQRAKNLIESGTSIDAILAALEDLQAPGAGDAAGGPPSGNVA